MQIRTTLEDLLERHASQAQCSPISGLADSVVQVFAESANHISIRVCVRLSLVSADSRARRCRERRGKREIDLFEVTKRQNFRPRFQWTNKSRKVPCSRPTWMMRRSTATYDIHASI